MSRALNRLTARSVAALSEKGMHADGGGLWLQVSAFGTKSWVFRYTRQGKTRDMGLGAIGDRTLAQAREAAAVCRGQLRDDIDPIEARDAERLKGRAAMAKMLTFQQAAERYITQQAPGWKSPTHAKQWPSTLKAYAYPVFGDISVAEVDTGLVMKVLEPIWTTKTETASRVRGRIEAILDWATVLGHRSGDNPARWKGHLQHMLAPKGKVAKVEHHSALPYGEIGTFVDALRKLEGTASKGLDFLILCGSRTSEVTGAKWDEINLEEKRWTIPGERMKAGKEHRVPLSTRAVDILKAMAEMREGEYVFPGAKEKRPLSNMAFLETLRRMGRGDLTAHGFRSTFRDWAAERTAYPHEMQEMALAHTIGDKVEAAYRRGDMFEKRRRMMQDWADYCSTVPKAGEGGNVVAIGQGRA